MSMELSAVKTWVSRHSVVTVQDDVLGVVRDIKAIDDRLAVYYNEQSNGFDIVERCLDGTDRLVFSVAELDARVVNRLRSSDHWHGQSTPTHVLSDDKDFLSQVDASNEEFWEGHAAKARDKVAEIGEALAYHLDLPLKGNVGYNESIFVGDNPLAKDDQGGDSGGAE